MIIILIIIERLRLCHWFFVFMLLRFNYIDYIGQFGRSLDLVTFDPSFFCNEMGSFKIWASLCNLCICAKPEHLHMSFSLVLIHFTWSGFMILFFVVET